MGVDRSPGSTQNESLKQLSRFGPKGSGTQVSVLVSFLEGVAQLPGPSTQESQRVGWRGLEEFRTISGQLAAFSEELEATIVRSHGALFLAPVLALLPTCCVTLANHYSLWASAFSSAKEKVGPDQ